LVAAAATTAGAQCCRDRRGHVGSAGRHSPAAGRRAFPGPRKNADVGGTWLENTYPGCRVDSNNQLYSYSFEPNARWPQFFSTQPVLLEYFRTITTKYKLRPFIRFNTDVEAMTFDDSQGVWRINVRKPDAEREVLTARIVISAVGQLNSPCFRKSGPEQFRAIHSTRRSGVTTFRSKDVASRVSARAPARSNLSRRLPRGLPPRGFPTQSAVADAHSEYHDNVGDVERWALENIPFYLSWYRFWLFWLYVDGFHEFVKCDPAYTADGRAVSAINAAVRDRFESVIRQQVGDHPTLMQTRRAELSFWWKAHAA